ncbi:hypothetical protein Tco_1576408 [Tanacetum coccineum]
MFEVSTILKDDSVELVSGGANGLIIASMFGEELGEGTSISMEVEEEEDAPALSDGSRVVVEMGVDTALGDLK